MGMLNYSFDQEKDSWVYKRDELLIETVTEESALEHLGKYFEYVKSMSQCSHILVLTNLTSFEKLFESNSGKRLLEELSCLVVGLKEFLQSIAYKTVQAQGDIIDTDDLYKEVMGKGWDQPKPHCGETAKYLYSVITKLAADIDLLKTKTCLKLLLREERHFPQTRRNQQYETNLLESIEIENSYRPNFPFTIELQYVDLVDLTEKSEGSEVIRYF